MSRKRKSLNYVNVINTRIKSLDNRVLRYEILRELKEFLNRGFMFEYHLSVESIFDNEKLKDVIHLLSKDLKKDIEALYS